MVRAVLAALAVGACLAVPDPKGTMYRCDQDPRCPDGLVCDGMTCVAAPSAEPGMVVIAGGMFAMGCPGVACGEGEQPEHQVMLRPFQIDQREVSEADFATCTSCRTGFVVMQPDQPMRSVQWSEASAYCAFLGRRLPTEAEWERAARVMEQPFPWGDAPPPDCAHAVGAGCAGPVDVTTPSQGDAPGPVHHLLGNVAEWVEDTWDAAFYANPAPVVEPHNEGGDPNERVLRGGSFLTPAADLVVWRRAHRDRIHRDPDIGFRCAK